MKPKLNVVSASVISMIDLESEVQSFSDWESAGTFDDDVMGPRRKYG